MKLTYYGHSCFSVVVGTKIVLFDPFITPNALAKHIDLNQVDADYILVSHGHSDHIADCITLAQATNATVITNWEIHEWLLSNGVKNVHPMNIGGKRMFDGFTVKCTHAVHSSSLPDRNNGGNPMGFLLTGSEGSFYYSGDTALTRDMELVAKWAKLNFAVLPIGDNFTMDASDAAECAVMIGCRTVVGVHYDTFGFIKIDHEEAKRTFANKGIELKLPGIGETCEFLS